MGRFALSGAGNFNRNFPDLLELIGADVGDRLGNDAAQNVAIIRDGIVRCD